MGEPLPQKTDEELARELAHHCIDKILEHLNLKGVEVDSDMATESILDLIDDIKIDNT